MLHAWDQEKTIGGLDCIFSVKFKVYSYPSAFYAVLHSATKMKIANKYFLLYQASTYYLYIIAFWRCSHIGARSFRRLERCTLAKAVQVDY